MRRSTLRGEIIEPNGIAWKGCMELIGTCKKHTDVFEISDGT